MGVRPAHKQTEAGVIAGAWDVKPLAKFVALQRGHDLTERDRQQGDVPVMGSAGPNGFHNTAIVCGPGVVLGRSGASFGQAHYCKTDFWPHNTVLYVTDFLGSHPLFTFYFLQGIDFSRYNSGGAQQSLNRNFIGPIPVVVPRREEQELIAEALSDADALIESLEQLLTKKRQLKQGAMHELLTGKKRLSGFSDVWEVRPFDAVLTRLNAKAHQIQTSDYQPTGKYPVVDQGKERIVAFSDRDDRRFRCPEGGVIVFGDHTCIVKFIDFDFLVGADGAQLLKAKSGQCTRFHALGLQHKGVEPTGYSRHFKLLKEREFFAPTGPEQAAIAAVLSDMDAVIAALETKLAKARRIKEGMMQELLTGRIRLL